VLELRGVGFAYGERVALRDVTLSFERARLTAIVGQSGAGKSTLLRLVAGLAAPSAGTVRIDGDDPRATARAQLARRVAYLPQEHTLAFPFTVAEVVLMGRYPHRGALALEDADDVRAAEDAMRRCDVIELAARRFHELSGGERRRALLAQAFCQAAELVLLDEPTASLDPAHALGILRALGGERDARGAAALWVTHDLNLAARFADRMIVMDGGAVVADGAPAEVLASDAAAKAFGVPLHVGTLPGGETFVVPA
jgi:iron complex transport system ATP-binding protein